MATASISTMMCHAPPSHGVQPSAGAPSIRTLATSRGWAPAAADAQRYVD